MELLGPPTWSQVGNFGEKKLGRSPPPGDIEVQNQFHPIWEGSRLDFGGPGPRFRRVPGRIFRDFGLENQELISNLPLKLRGSAWELELPLHLTPTSNFNHDFPKGVGGGEPPPGVFNGIGQCGVKELSGSSIFTFLS